MYAKHLEEYLIYSKGLLSVAVMGTSKDPVWFLEARQCPSLCSLCFPHYTHLLHSIALAESHTLVPEA